MKTVGNQRLKVQEIVPIDGACRIGEALLKLFRIGGAFRIGRAQPEDFNYAELCDSGIKC